MENFVDILKEAISELTSGTKFKFVLRSQFEKAVSIQQIPLEAVSTEVFAKTQPSENLKRRFCETDMS